MKKIICLCLMFALLLPSALYGLTGCMQPPPAASADAGAGATEGADASFAGADTATTAADAATTAAAETATTAAANTAFDLGREITVVSREDGSGTRGAFIELLGIQVKDADGNSKDMTTKEAIIADKTDIMMTNIANDPYAIGYISMGSVNNTIKALDIDGVEATAGAVKDGSYKIQRPFTIATKGAPSGIASDFINYILSAEGQRVVTDNNYIAIDESAGAYTVAAEFASAPVSASDKLVIAGSSSVTPLMEKLREAYLALNPGATIEIHMTDSSAGMASAIDGTCDIGMSSRELKESESAELDDISIALDGIAVIVSNENPISGLSAETVRAIFTGEISKWGDVASSNNAR